jgi:AcrR family transcriptional regulator
MSKATFYEHFDNKEDCIVALHDAATTAVLEAMRRTGDDYAGRTPRGRVGAVIHTFLEVAGGVPDEAQTLLVEIIGAGRARWSGATACWPSTRPTSTRSTARTRAATASSGSRRRTTRSRSSAR